MADRTVDILLVARDQASRAFDAAGNSADKANTKSRALAAGIGTFAGGAALAGVAALGAGITTAFQGAEEAARVTRLLDNQIKNLGPSGKAAFGSATEFADKLGASIGKDDDDIKAVQTKLASFPDAFRQGSLGAEAMRRATAAAFDLEAIGIGAAESNIVGIGKALNDPIKGMTALSKAGVSFSEQQKQQIKAAVEQGDLAKAQSILLAGIESNAKGAAEAGASNLDKLKVKAANLAEGLAGNLIPVIDKFAGGLLGLGDKVGPGFTKVKAGIQGVFDLLVKGDFTGKLAEAFGISDDDPIVIKLLELRATAQQVIAAVVGFFRQAAAVAGPALRSIGAVITGQVIPALASFGRAMAPIISFLVSVLGPTVIRIFGAVLTVIRGAFQVIAGIFNVFAALLTGDWSRLWLGVRQILSGAWTIIRGIFSAGLAAVTAVFRVGVAALSAVARAIVSGVTGVIRGLVGSLRSLGGQIIDGLVSGIRGAAGKVFAAARDVVNRIPPVIRRAMGIKSPSKVTAGLGGDIMAGLLVGMQRGAPAVERFVDGLALTPSVASSTLSPARAGGGMTVVVQAGAVGSEDYLARTIRDVLARTSARGYGY
jgi:phage-related protein